MFAQHQEGTRKHVEQAFGVMQSCFKIGAEPTRLWEHKQIDKIMWVCIVLHNMIVEDEKDMLTQYDLNETPGSSIALPPELNNGATPSFADVIRRDVEVCDWSMHARLKGDLVEHIWGRFSHNSNN